MITAKFLLITRLHVCQSLVDIGERKFTVRAAKRLREDFRMNLLQMTYERLHSGKWSIVFWAHKRIHVMNQQMTLAVHLEIELSPTMTARKFAFLSFERNRKSLKENRLLQSNAFGRHKQRLIVVVTV